MCLKPSDIDLKLTIALAAVPAFVWIAILCHVISTYESGEVVELSIDTIRDTYTARVWVFEMGADPAIYYDAEPEVAQSLLAGKSLLFMREGEVSTRISEASLVHTLPESESNQIFEAMTAKYGDRMRAANAYYFLLGNSRIVSL